MRTPAGGGGALTVYAVPACLGDMPQKILHLHWGTHIFPFGQ